MPTGDCGASWVLVASVLCSGLLLGLAGRGCELSVLHRNALYNYSLASPTANYPHGVMSEDGFYKVVVNDTVLWFQLCDQMIFNHDPPSCYDCQDCGGPMHCGMKCSALVAHDMGGYQACRTIGRARDLHVGLIDITNPQEGVVVKMAASDPRGNCSLSVSVFCDTVQTQVLNSLNVSGTCDYAAALKHPSGCAKIISANGKGWGWFGTLMIIILCLIGGYMLLGTVYRFFFLGIHGVEAIPNLEFWLSLPQRARGMLGSLVRRFGRHPRDSPGSYAPMD